MILRVPNLIYKFRDMSVNHELFDLIIIDVSEAVSSIEISIIEEGLDLIDVLDLIEDLLSLLHHNLTRSVSSFVQAIELLLKEM